MPRPTRSKSMTPRSTRQASSASNCTTTIPRSAEPNPTSRAASCRTKRGNREISGSAIGAVVAGWSAAGRPPPAMSHANFGIAPLARPDLVERQPELLAHHLTAAGDIERAVTQWLKAGRHAAERSTHLEAISHFERGLAALTALPQGAARDEREIELQLARGVSLFVAKGLTPVEGAEAYARACELAEKRGETS